MKFDTELVGKIGSMALIDKERNILDYTLIAKLSSELKPGYIWVTSGAVETGRLDFIKRTGKELKGNPEDVKTDYSAQGQTILMERGCFSPLIHSNGSFTMSRSSGITLRTRFLPSVTLLLAERTSFRCQFWLNGAPTRLWWSMWCS